MAIRLSRKAGQMCCQGSKKQNDVKINTPGNLQRLRENGNDRVRPEKSRNFRETDPRPGNEDKKQLCATTHFIGVNGIRCSCTALGQADLFSGSTCFFTGIRLFEDDDFDSTDAMEALAFQHNRQHIDIYSCSWGPEDTGWTMDGPGKLAEDQLAEGAKTVE